MKREKLKFRIVDIPIDKTQEELEMENKKLLDVIEMVFLKLSQNETKEQLNGAK